ncbi:hypothetical protein B5M09_006306 [Aphanomyces astaci]|uniref:Uncharacterized protein n=1 Tax=Aphanomyces astaci TaxID=112090 RepID=A0A3R7XVZ9_APHAT|nr:hypothetical protein B5M09_006306 [Aphanomyces astaci]
MRSKPWTNSTLCSTTVPGANYFSIWAKCSGSRSPARVSMRPKLPSPSNMCTIWTSFTAI